MIEAGQVIMMHPVYDNPNIDEEERRDREGYQVLQIVSPYVVLCKKLAGGYRESFSFFELCKNGYISRELFPDVKGGQRESIRKWRAP